MKQSRYHNIYFSWEIRKYILNCILTVMSRPEYVLIFCLQLLTIDKIKHAERLRGGGDVRGSLNSSTLDWGK